MKSTKSIPLLVLLACAAIFQLNPVLGAEPGKKVLAHYMCWFENRPYRGNVQLEHWSYKLHGTPHDAQNILPDGKRDVASVYYPLIGPYDSNDPDVIEYHVLSAKVAGIDGFVIDWYLPESITDISLQKLAPIAAKYQFEFAACYEEKVSFPGYRNPVTRADSVNIAVGDFSYILNQYGSKNSYLKIDGKPSIFMFVGFGEFAGQAAVFNYMELAEIREKMKNPNWILFRQNLDPVFWQSARGSFEWVGDEAYHDWFQKSAKEMKSNKKIDYVALGIGPGFDSSGVSSWGQDHKIIPREDGKYYTQQWDRAIGANPDLVQIITWNDFQEGSVIEPTFEFGNQYLDLTEQMVGKFNGRKVDLTDNGLPFKIYQLRKRAWQRYGGEPDELKDTNAQIDKAAQTMIQGKSAAASKMLDELADDLEYKWLAKIPAQKEFARYLPTTGKEKDLDDAYNLIRSSFNLARAKTVTCSSGDPDAPDPSKVVDLAWNSRWSSQYKEPEWLKIDLGKTESFSKIIIDWEPAYGKAYSIEVSDDDNQWKEIYSTKDSKGGLQTITFPKAQGRYVRFNLKERATSWGFSIWEIGIF